MWDATFGAEELSYISSYQTFTADKNGEVIKQSQSLLKMWLYTCNHRDKAVKELAAVENIEKLICLVPM